jgi:ABC-type uncharacterized transport system auxiliary subunit
LPIYTLNAVRDFPPLSGPQRGQISIPEPAALMSLSSDKILIDRDGSVGASIENAQWSDNLPVLFQAKMIESFEDSGYFQAVSRPIDAFDADDQVLTDLRTFRIVTTPKPAAVVAYTAKVLNGGRMKATHLFEATVPISGTDGASAVAGLNQAFDETVKALVPWAAANIGPPSTAPAAEPTDMPPEPNDAPPQPDAP